MVILRSIPHFYKYLYYLSGAKENGLMPLKAKQQKPVRYTEKTMEGLYDTRVRNDQVNVSRTLVSLHVPEKYGQYTFLQSGRLARVVYERTSRACTSALAWCSTTRKGRVVTHAFYNLQAAGIYASCVHPPANN